MGAVANAGDVWVNGAQPFGERGSHRSFSLGHVGPKCANICDDFDGVGPCLEGDFRHGLLVAACACCNESRQRFGRM